MNIPHPFLAHTFAGLLCRTGLLCHTGLLCRTGLLCLAGLLSLATPLDAQLRHEETDIPVRDGKTLAADVYVNAGSGRKPVILVQTPYGKAPYRIGVALFRMPGFPLDSSRYHYVVVDWRGFHASAGAAVAGYDRGLDGFDIVEWIAAQPWCDGKVATWGGSALGLIQFQTARHHPPHLVCAAPFIKDFKTKYSDYYYGGVLRREHVTTLEQLGFTSVDLITSQPMENAVWRQIAASSDNPDEIAVPMLLASGWFDHYPDDVIRAFDDLRDRGAEPGRAQHRLIMGPWGHSDIDRAKQGELVFPDAEDIARDAALAFFDYHLHGAKNGWPLTSAMRYYQMGENVWRDCARWRDVGTTTRPLFLSSGGRLLDAPEDDGGSNSFVADPRDPSPSHGGARFNPFDPAIIPGPLDIRNVVESRGDVLLFTTDPLRTDLVVTGSSRLRLYVRCDRPDADVSVRLCDVYPDGRSIILTDGIQRARFRAGNDREVFMQADSVHAIDIALQELAHTFLEGHRLRVVIGGSDFPRFDVNPNSGGALYLPGDTLSARYDLMHSTAWPSSIVLETPDDGTAVDPAATANTLRLDAPWPMPYRGQGSLRLRCTAPAGAVVHAEIRDLLGRRVRRLAENADVRIGNDGSGVLRWDGRDDRGQALPSGTYLIMMTADDAFAMYPATLMR
ncbi:MAG: CocE/NonD family hydrolase [Bacteroidota bacterium]|nr:CocE/NonD family hydrolase [Bacteroidota bacterium]